MALAGRFGPPLALMALIFFLSAQPRLGTDLGVIDLIGRKIAHMVEYAALWFLWWRALGRRRRETWIAAGIAFAYACSDEFHQSFVDGRVGSPIDVAIDTAGIGLAIYLTRRWNRAAPDRSGRAGATTSRAR